MKWISVKDELPEEEDFMGTTYLITDGDDIGMAGFHKGYFRPASIEFYSLGTNATAFITVTHWMPLPPPPSIELVSSYICDECATNLKATAPKGHVCTSHVGICNFCNKSKRLCHTSDFNWPKKHKHLERNREI